MKDTTRKRLHREKVRPLKEERQKRILAKKDRKIQDEKDLEAITFGNFKL